MSGVAGSSASFSSIVSGLSQRRSKLSTSAATRRSVASVCAVSGFCPSSGSWVLIRTMIISCGGAPAPVAPTTCASSKPAVASTSRTSCSLSRPSGLLISTTEPPMKSIPKFSPRVDTVAIDATIKIVDRIAVGNRHRIKPTLVFFGQSFRSMVSVSF